MNIYRSEQQGDFIYVGEKPFPKKENYEEARVLASVSYDIYRLDLKKWYDKSKQYRVADSEIGKFQGYFMLKDHSLVFEKQLKRRQKEGIEIDSSCFRIELLSQEAYFVSVPANTEGKTAKRTFSVSFIRDLDQQIARGDISYSRMVEILNEKHNSEISVLKKERDRAVELLNELNYDRLIGSSNSMKVNEFLKSIKL